MRKTSLLYAADEIRTDKYKPVTQQEAAVAVERLLADDDAERIRDHFCPEAADDEPEEEIARDFLDRRDEARISHRLDRPFRFQTRGSATGRTPRTRQEEDGTE